MYFSHQVLMNQKVLTLSAHAREGYSSHVSLFDFGEGAVFKVETYINTF